MHLRSNLLILFLLCPLFVFAQNNEVIFTINNKNVYLSEFKEALNKSNIENKNDKEACQKFLNQFIEFKLKVFEAEKQGLNKKAEILSQVKAFKKNLILPYLTDKQYVEKLAHEAYQRMKTEYHVRQILIRVSAYAAPKDTMVAYDRALSVKKKLLSGENFESIALSVSDAFNTPLNKGDLWYIGPFKLPYKIENYIYSNPKSKISAPIRSKLGYHIIEILDKRPYQGSIKVAHIMIALPLDTAKNEQEKARIKINEVYQKLLDGQDFKQLAIQYSDDKGAAISGGELPFIETGDMEHEFERACFNLTSDGAFSKPVKTSYGWHIIKRISKQDLPPFTELKDKIEKKVIKSERGELAKEQALQSIKSNYNFKDYHDFFGIFEILDSTIFEGVWKKPEFAELNEKMFEFNNRVYYQKDFVNFLESNQGKMFPIPISTYVKIKYDDFIEEVLFDFEAKQIETGNPYIYSRLREFEENILAYKIFEKEVVSKYSETAKIENYYNKHKQDYNKKYQADVSIFAYSEGLRKVEKLFMKLKKQQISDIELIAKIKSNLDLAFELITNSVIEEGNEPLVDLLIKKYKTGSLNKDKKFFAFDDEKKIVWLNSEIAKTDKTFEEVEEDVAIDYRQYIMQQWIKELKSDYKVEINQDTFESIFNN